MLPQENRENAEIASYGSTKQKRKKPCWVHDHMCLQNCGTKTDKKNKSLSLKKDVCLCYRPICVWNTYNFR